MFSEKLKVARASANVSQKELAGRLYISQQAYAKYETGASTPNPDILKKIANELNVSADYLLGSYGTRKKGVKIPVLGEVQAGIPIEAIEDILDYEEISEELAAHGEYFALKIRGNSMEPKFSEGDVVIVRQQPDVDSGTIAVVLVNGDSATIKKVVKHQNGVSLVSLNPVFEPMYYTSEEVEGLPLVILGKVVELRAKF